MKKVFISYSHRDEAWKIRLQKHLAVLENQGLLSIWDDRQIDVGDDWLSKIEQAIESADIAILLISADFLSSKFIVNIEVKNILDRHAKSGLRILSLMLRPCAWETLCWLSNIQARPKDNKPLSSFTTNLAEYHMAEFTKEIYKLLQSELKIKSPQYNDEVNDIKTSIIKKTSSINNLLSQAKFVYISIVLFFIIICYFVYQLIYFNTVEVDSMTNYSLIRESKKNTNKENSKTKLIEPLSNNSTTSNQLVSPISHNADQYNNKGDTNIQQTNKHGPNIVNIK